MGKRSDLTVSQRGEVVLMLLRREEPAAEVTRCETSRKLQGRPRGFTSGFSRRFGFRPGGGPARRG